MDTVALYANLMCVVLIIVLVFAVVSVVAGVSVSVVLVNATGCLGLEDIYGGCDYFC